MVCRWISELHLASMPGPFNRSVYFVVPSTPNTFLFILKGVIRLSFIWK